MPCPAFFDDAPRISLRDPLAVFLGGSDDGVFEYGYLDAVKLAGHSCPTVAGTWLMLRAGLAALYPGEMPERGAIAVSFPEAADQGVTGVMANVASLVTGARGDDGFHGIAGRFRRDGLLHFDADVPAVMSLRRVDTGATVHLAYHPELVQADPAMRPLLQRCLAGMADEAEEKEFGRLWQDRVRRILVDYADDPGLVRVAQRTSAAST